MFNNLKFLLSFFFGRSVWVGIIILSPTLTLLTSLILIFGIAGIAANSCELASLTPTDILDRLSAPARYNFSGKRLTLELYLSAVNFVAPLYVIIAAPLLCAFLTGFGRRIGNPSRPLVITNVTRPLFFRRVSHRARVALLIVTCAAALLFAAVLVWNMIRAARPPYSLPWTFPMLGDLLLILAVLLLPFLARSVIDLTAIVLSERDALAEAAAEGILPAPLRPARTVSDFSFAALVIPPVTAVMFLSALHELGTYLWPFILGLLTLILLAWHAIRSIDAGRYPAPLLHRTALYIGALAVLITTPVLYNIFNAIISIDLFLDPAVNKLDLIFDIIKALGGILIVIYCAMITEACWAIIGLGKTAAK